MVILYDVSISTNPPLTIVSPSCSEIPQANQILKYTEEAKPRAIGKAKRTIRTLNWSSSIQSSREPVMQLASEQGREHSGNWNPKQGLRCYFHGQIPLRILHKNEGGCIYEFIAYLVAL